MILVAVLRERREWRLERWLAAPDVPVLHANVEQFLGAP
jgi:hypothetical protein